MSLLKTITNVNGIITTYHRIGSVTKNRNNISVEVLSYVSAEYRDRETELLEMRNVEPEKTARISVLSGTTPLTAEQSEEYEALLAWQNKYNELSAVDRFHACSNNAEIEWESEDISFTDLYIRLKETELFAGAEDC